MNFERLTEYIASKLLTLNINGLTKEDIHLPNSEFQASRRGLWLEITIGKGEQENWSERTERRMITINQIVCVPAGSGTDRVNYIAHRIQSLYAPYIPEKSGFTVGGARFRVLSCNQMTPDYQDGTFKVNVRLVVEKYEEER